MDKKIYCKDCKHLFIYDNEDCYDLESARCNSFDGAIINWYSDKIIKILSANPKHLNDNNDCKGFERGKND